MNFDALATTEIDRMNGFEAMAAVFDQVDLLITAVNPDIAPPAETTLMIEIEGKNVDHRQRRRPHRSRRTSPATRRRRSPPATSTGCPSGSRSSAATTPTACCSTSRCSPSAERPWPLVAPGAPL